MSVNTYLTDSMISNESLMILTNTLQFTKLLNKDFEGTFGRTGMKQGESYAIRKPVMYKNSTGPVLDLQASTETSVNLSLTNWAQRGLAFETKDLTLSIDNFSSRFIKPATVSMANQIDQYNLAQLIVQVPYFVGTPGTSPASTDAYNDLVSNAGVVLQNNLAPNDEMPSLMVSPKFAQLGFRYNTTLFNPAPEISESFVNGFLGGQALGANFYRTQVLPNFTAGTYGGTPLINGTTVSGASSFVTDGWTATTTTLNVGDIITVAGVYDVNGQTKQTYGNLKPFVVTAKTTTDGGGNSTIQISPAVVGPGSALQNVSALPADNAAITVVSGASGATTGQQLLFVDVAFTGAFVDFEMPGAGMGVVMTKSADPEIGVSLTYTKGYDIVNFREIHRIDNLSGVVSTYPQLAVRVFTAPI